MSQERNDLEPDVLAVLRTAKPTEAPDDARARILSTVLARTQAPVAGGEHGDRNDAGSRVSPRAARGAWIASHPLLAVSCAFVLGGAVALLARGSVPDRVVYVDREVPVVVPSLAPRVPAGPSSSVSSPTSVPVESLPLASDSAVKGSGASESSGEQLAAESSLLDVARTSLAQGEPERALAAVDRHASQFPRGLLREEREALAVKALVLANRADEARTRAARFRERYSDSLFLPAIEASLRSIP